MKNIIISVLTFISCAVYSQNQRFIYEYKFVSDSTAKDKTESETMYLDISKKGSKFYSHNKAVADSLIKEMDKKGTHDFKNITFGKVNHIVEKTYPDYKILFFDRVDMDTYKISDDRVLDWKISPEKEKIGAFNAQKATTNFAGRQWVAWFTTEIPFQDGPYKFRGLPGLIIKIEDKSKSHSFVLAEVKKLKTNEIWLSENEKETQFHRPMISVDIEKYKKIYIDQRNNPTKGMKQLLAQGGNVKFIDENGKELDASKMMRDQERAAKEKNKKDNNLLELNLLK